MSRAADNDMLGLQNACYEYTNYFIVPGLPKNRRNRRVHIASVFLCLERTSVIIMIAEIVQIICLESNKTIPGNYFVVGSMLKKQAF